MPGARRHRERHRTNRIGWLRAAVLGANDGIVSTASLVAGVAAANATHADVVAAAPLQLPQRSRAPPGARGVRSRTSGAYGTRERSFAASPSKYRRPSVSNT